MIIPPNKATTWIGSYKVDGVIDLVFGAVPVDIQAVFGFYTGKEWRMPIARRAHSNFKNEHVGESSKLASFSVSLAHARNSMVALRAMKVRPLDLGAHLVG